MYSPPAVTVTVAGRRHIELTTSLRNQYTWCCYVSGYALALFEHKMSYSALVTAAVA